MCMPIFQAWYRLNSVMNAKVEKTLPLHQSTTGKATRKQQLKMGNRRQRLLTGLLMSMVSSGPESGAVGSRMRYSSIMASTLWCKRTASVRGESSGVFRPEAPGDAMTRCSVEMKHTLTTLMALATTKATMSFCVMASHARKNSRSCVAVSTWMATKTAGTKKRHGNCCTPSHVAHSVDRKSTAVARSTRAVIGSPSTSGCCARASNVTRTLDIKWNIARKRPTRKVRAKGLTTLCIDTKATT
mmetsp:Transcript_85626/g.247139  ORF Transcript_85626/g.247139 Transcript_85626/m.247139 type:complete len:243 (+) Transcript_85626:1518-2246(+)